MNGRAIPGAYLFTFRLTNVIPERTIFVIRGMTVFSLWKCKSCFYICWVFRTSNT